MASFVNSLSNEDNIIHMKILALLTSDKDKINLIHLVYP